GRRQAGGAHARACPALGVENRVHRHRAHAARAAACRMSPIALTDSELREVQQAAQMVPYERRQAFLERLASELRGKVLGDGLVHKLAYAVAREIAWDVDRPEVERCSF